MASSKKSRKAAKGGSKKKGRTASAPVPPASEGWNCSADATGNLKQMFVDIVQARRIKQGQSPARRPVFLKLHGVAHGRFDVVADLPAELQVGVFALRSVPVWVRFSSDTVPSRPDFKTTCGIGIKLFDVAGEKLEGNAPTQDFILLG